MEIDWTGKKEYETDVRGYFPCCPICGDKRIEVHLTNGSIDIVVYESIKV
jgi:hypothetical protein